VSKKQKAEGRGQKGKGAKAAKGSAAPRSAGEVRLSEHPRARHQIRIAKAWAGVAGVVLAGYASWHGGAPFFDTALRALLWGIAAYVLVWFCAVLVWRQLAIAEVRGAEKLWLERKHEAEREARERAAQDKADRAATLAGSPRA
jgi:hypothetical protein